jgi:diaminohydroxyphosphoribosylaminopyrimidine deaminase / 5-amino-6-(5-phosphoribosylamino)uracil reductase
MPEKDETYMRLALELAEQGRGYVEPNPLVGAVVVREGNVVGRGWHERFGQAHAERNALLQAEGFTQGATLYLTLEPCCHHGKTPPCTDAILRAGIVRVVVAMTDPFPQVAGRGLAILREACIAVDIGLLNAESRHLSAPYLKLLATGRPYVHAKWAMTLDGKIATRTGNSKWISGPGSRQHSHALRGRMDATIVGIGTVLADDPLLTARPPGPRVATRVILDSEGRLPANSQLARTAHEVPTIVVVREGCDAASRLRSFGIEIVELPAKEGFLDIGALLDELGRRRMTNVLVEGGSAVLGSFLDVGALDEVRVFIAPRLAGGEGARAAIGGIGIEKIADAEGLAEWKIETIESDLFIHGRTASSLRAADRWGG